MTCQEPSCERNAEVHFSVVRERRVVLTKTLCESHADEFWQIQVEHDQLGTGVMHRTPGALSFDIELVACNRSTPSAWIALREIQGSRRLTVATGAAEAWGILYELDGQPSPRPLTHRAFANAIAELGGSVEHVVVDGISEDRETYYATVQIRQRRRPVLLDVRPSDAFALALVCNVPILVSDQLLMQL